MKLTPEQLLHPRYEVIADYPNSPFTIGEILSDYGTLTRPSFIQRSSGNQIRVDVVEKYPHLFRRLEWWEKRKPEDMPDYVKSIKTNKIYKIRNWSLDAKNNIYFIFEEEPNVHLGYYQHLYLPATLKDYTDYITKTK